MTVLREVNSNRKYAEDGRSVSEIQEEAKIKNSVNNYHTHAMGTGLHQPAENPRTYKTHGGSFKVMKGDPESTKKYDSDVSETEIMNEKWNKGIEPKFNCLGWDLGGTLGKFYNKQDYMDLCDDLTRNIDEIGEEIRDNLVK